MQKKIPMPKMGESVFEGTVTEWFKEVGDYVERDEPLLEITTDKVDSEVASPVDGVVVERLVEPGETVEVETTIAVIDTEAEPGDTPELDDDLEAVAGGEAGDEGGEKDESDGAGDEETSQPSTIGESEAAEGSDDEFPSRAELRRKRSTPVVRRIAEEHGIDDLTQIEGTGLSGRVTKEDIQAYIDAGKHLDDQRRGRQEPTSPRREVESPDIEVGDRDRVEMLGPHRSKIAEHMVRSRAVSAHAQTIHEVDFSSVVDHRKANKEEFAERGVDLTYTAYLIKAAAEALQAYPMVNASLRPEEEEVVYRGDINIGMAVALEASLIVPVVENADELSLLGIAREVNDLADRARNKQLGNDEVRGGTFTVSNHGVFGPEFGIPIINQPQSAIVSTGAIKKRVVVDQETEAIQVKPTSMWCLSFDHRLIDGATADKFMRRMRTEIEEW